MFIINNIKLINELTYNIQKFFFFFNFFIFKQNTNFFKILIFFLINERVCLLGKTDSKLKYIKACGCFGFFRKLNIFLKQCLILMPSGFFKKFNYFSFIAKNSIIFFKKKKKIFLYKKAGYLRNFGKKQINKGIKMNPIDHPHGGRTRVIKYPRTP